MNSKGVVENLCGYAQRDLLVPALLEPEWRDLDDSNEAARRWCAEVNGQVHSETCAVPAERLLSERDVLRPLPAGRPPLRAGDSRTVDKRGSIRFGSARYLVPNTLVGESVEVVATEDKVVMHQGGTEVIRHNPVGPGEVACGDLVDPHRRPALASVRAPRQRLPSLVLVQSPRCSCATPRRPAPYGWSTS